MGRQSEQSSSPLVFGAAGLLAALIAGIIALSLVYGGTAFHAERNHHLQALLMHLKSEVHDAELAQKAYLLTGDARTLEPLARAVRHAAADMAELRRLSDATEAHLSARIDTLLREKLAHLQRAVDLRRAGNLAQATAIATEPEGSRLLAELRTNLAHFHHRDPGFLGDLGFAGRWTEHLIAAVLIALVLGLVGTLVLWRRQAQVRSGQLASQNVALLEARQEAERATAAKSRFLAAASHDLRQPLHAVTLFTRSLSRRVATDETKKLVQQIEQSLGHLRSMFDALLNVSRLDAGLLRPTLVRVHVRDVIEQLTPAFAAEARQRGLKLKVRSIDAVIMTDPAILEAMLRNLVANALKFTVKGGVLVVARRRQRYISIEVWDSGPGIAEDMRDQVFTEFSRSARAATGTNDGLGLGLALVKRYGRLLDIFVSLTSRPGHGSRFTLLVAEDQSANSLEPFGAVETPASADIRGRRIMVIDDDPAIVAAVTRDLCDRHGDAHGFPSTAAAEQALLQGFDPELAVVDFDLRGAETGPDFMARIEAETGRRVPMVVLSGGTDQATLSALYTGHAPWLTKPAHPDAVAVALDRLARRLPPARPSHSEVASPKTAWRHAS